MTKNRQRQKEITKQCENYYRSCETFKTYEGVCSLCHEVCRIDDGVFWLDMKDEHDANIFYNSIINPCTTNADNIYDNTGMCIGCCYSNNYTKDFDQWEATPDDLL